MDKSKLHVTVNKLRVDLQQKKVTAEITVDYIFDTLTTPETMKQQIEEIIRKEMTDDLPLLSHLAKYN